MGIGILPFTSNGGKQTSPTCQLMWRTRVMSHASYSRHTKDWPHCPVSEHYWRSAMKGRIMEPNASSNHSSMQCGGEVCPVLQIVIEENYGVSYSTSTNEQFCKWSSPSTNLLQLTRKYAYLLSFHLPISTAALRFPAKIRINAQVWAQRFDLAHDCLREFCQWLGICTFCLWALVRGGFSCYISSDEGAMKISYMFIPMRTYCAGGNRLWS